ncbi:MAG TPA: protein kinase, partial [Roseiflexaceae bacterium]|nr:protein kinase [Roseiflexaceae bacterium]
MVDLAGRNLGPYRLIEQLGVGGMATIYRAYHAAMDRYVAIKVLPRHLASDPTFRARFEQEARTIARLEHRHILPVYDAGEDHGISYLVMRFSEGGTLNDLIGAGRLTFERAVRLVSQVGEALACAHQRGVIHRDVKPANVLLSRDGDALLTDFGIAKLMEGSLQITGDGSLIGTPAYMAPEQVLGQPVDGRADLYALGIILYEALTGTRPFEADTPLALALMQVYNPPRSPRHLNPDIPDVLEQLIVRALAKESAERYQTAEAMVEALNQVLAQVATHAGTAAPRARARGSADTVPLPELTSTIGNLARPSATVMIDRRRLREALQELASGHWEHVLPLLEGMPVDDPNVVALRQEALNQLVKRRAAEQLDGMSEQAELEPPANDGAQSQTGLAGVRLDMASRAPYIGLNTFQEQDQAFFYGRDALVGTLVGKAQRTPLMVVLGPSGSGKSSVTLAGLVPALKRGALLGSSRWRYLTLRPGARPLDALAVALTTLEGGDLTSALGMIELLSGDSHGLLQAARRLGGTGDRARLVLVIDQFEELWTQAPADPAARKTWLAQQQRPFVQLLLTAAAFVGANGDPPVLIVLTMRADFLHRAAEERELSAWISEHNVIVSPMSADDLRMAIEQPARATGGKFEPGLIDELIEQVEGQPGALPLLEYTLLELWKTRRSDGTITWTSFRALGGVEGALAARADAILAAHYTSAKRETVRQLLVRLVQPGEGAADTRRRALLEDLVPVGGSAEQVRALLKPLIDERLITSSRDAVTGAETLEVSHEALIRAWPTLSAWVDEVREDLRLQLYLEEAAKEWRDSAENAGFLWSGLRLDRAQEWLDRARPLLNERAQRFLEASRAQEQQRAADEEADRRERARLLAEQTAARRNTARLRIFLAIVGVLLVLAIVSAGFALVSRQQALGAQATAQALALSADDARADSQALARAGEALVELERRPERALLLALSAAPVDPGADYPPMVARAFYRAFDEVRVRDFLAGHSDGIRAAAWSPDGRLALTASTDSTARIWDSASGTTLHTLAGHTAGIRAAAWSPDGRLVLTGAADHSARIWDSATGKIVRVFENQPATILAVAWSPDSRQILTGDETGGIRVWDAATGALIRRLTGHTAAIRAAEWSPDGQWILTSSSDQFAMIWQAASGALAQKLQGHTGAVLAVTWSPDGRLVLTGGEDTTARIWDVATGEPVRSLRGHTNWVYAVAWSPDGSQALTGSADNSARIWDAASGALLQTLRGHTNWVHSVAWSPDGTQALTGSADGTTRIWDVATERS